MNKLDNSVLLRRLDKSNMIGSIESLSRQGQQALEEVSKLTIPTSYKKINNILINGMGGSALGGQVIKVLFADRLRVPCEVINSYDLPAYVNKHTLYLISSYSGNTEEPVGTLQPARKKKAKILIITSGGALARLTKRYKLPGYIFNPRFNPSNQPRMGLGYSIFGQLALLNKVGIITISRKEFVEAIHIIISLHKKFGQKVPTKKNPAKQLAVKLNNRIPIIVASEFLTGNAHIVANQLNENSKNFSAYFVISELNHHLMEGMRFPSSNRRNLHFVFIDSSLYLAKNRQRRIITQKVLVKNNINYSVYKTKGKTKLSQVFEVLLFGSYVNYYLALLHGIDPSPIPYVNYFKKQLA